MKATIAAIALATGTTLVSNADVKKHRNGFTTDDAVTGMVTDVTFYSPSIVKITKQPSGHTSEHKSFSVIKSPEKVNLKYNGDAVSSECITVTAMPGGGLSFSSADGTRLLDETASHHETRHGDADEGALIVSQGWRLDEKEPIYGLGQRQNAKLNQRGEKVRIWSGNTNITIPYFTSVKGYGVYWDNPGDSMFDDSGEETSFTSEVADGIHYYFIYSDGSQDGVIASIRDLTGDAPMFPLWTNGYWQSRERYKTPDELCDVLDRHRRAGVPLDGIVQDWQYWGCDSNWNAMAFMNPHYINKMGDSKWMRYLPYDEDPQATYPAPRIKTPEEMVKYVHDNNAHIMISIWASFGPWTSAYAEMDSIGALLDFETWPLKRGVKPYDTFNPEARDIYWKYLTNLYDMGFDAWWTDSTEPDHWEKPGDSDHMTAAGTWRSVKNAFPLVTNGGIHDHQHAMPGHEARRSVQMTRCGAFGMQRYGAFSWSGDVVSDWNIMKNQIPSGLNYVICGLPYWNTDLGGFFGWEYRNDCSNPALAELQVRWVQWGAFMPLMRNHCSSPLLNEIYQWGGEGDWQYDVQKQYIKLRYALMPYIYALNSRITRDRDTMMRPLVMDFAGDSTAVEIDDEYMFGPAFLVKPVTDPLYTYRDDDHNGHTIYPDVRSAAAPVRVYLPGDSSTVWHDFWDNTTHRGGVNIQRPAPIDIMPVYVRGGSIVPFGPDVQYTGEKPWDSLEIRVYPGADGSFTLYEDEGDNYNYEKGMFSEIDLDWNDSERTLTIGKRRGEYPGMLTERDFRVSLPGGDIRTVRYNGNQVTVQL